MPDWILTLILVPLALLPLVIIGLATRISPRPAQRRPSQAGGQHVLNPDWVPPTMPRMCPPPPAPASPRCCCHCPHARTEPLPCGCAPSAHAEQIRRLATAMRHREQPTCLERP